MTLSPSLLGRDIESLKWRIFLPVRITRHRSIPHRFLQTKAQEFLLYSDTSRQDIESLRWRIFLPVRITRHRSIPHRFLQTKAQELLLYPDGLFSAGQFSLCSHWSH